MPETTGTYKPLVLVDTENLPEDEWLEWRRRGIGGSDAAAILGVSPFATARDLYYDKLKVISYEDGESNWVAKKVGHLLEDLVAEIFHVKTGFRIYQVKKMFYHPVYTYMLADIDYFIELPNGKTAILEIKTTNYNAKDHWWCDGQEIVPINYEIQGRHYMCVMNIDEVYYCCLYGNNEDEVIIRHIVRDLDYEAELIDLEGNFWNNHIQTQIPPPYTEDGDLIIESARRHFGPADENAPDIELSIPLASSVVRYTELQAEKSVLNQEVKRVDNEMKRLQGRTPLKNENDPPEKSGAKYIWLSSSGKPKGTSSGSPVHFVGDSNAGVVYVTEGFLKSDVAHYLMNRTFVATAGANNTAQLEVLLKQLADNGTHTIIEAEDMDKYRNQAVNKGALKLYELAKKYGMECRGLNWNPNYKGIDDWQLALRQSASVKEDRKKNFKQRFVYSLCHFDAIDDEVESWHENTECECELHEHLGLTSEEYSLLLSDPAELERRLLSKRQEQKFRIYQLDISLLKVIPFAFGGLKDMQKYHEYPPAAEYRLVHEGTLCFDESEDDYQRLMRIAETFGNTLPSEYRGRSVAPSDVLELYDETGRRYFYRDTDGFCPVKFSPMLAKK